MLSSFSGSEEDDNVSIISQEKDATLDISQLDALTRAQTLQLDGSVAHNRAKIFMARSIVSENSMMISQNYSSAFMVNRRIANENMDAMFRVRCGIIQCLPVQDELSFQFREAQLNSMKIDFLTFRSKADANATRITSDLAALAATSVEINKTISEANEEIRQYNLRTMQENAYLFERLKAELRSVSVESNLALLQSNSEKLRELSLHSNTTAGSIDRLLQATEETRAAIAANTEVTHSTSIRRGLYHRIQRIYNINCFYRCYSLLVNLHSLSHSLLDPSLCRTRTLPVTVKSWSTATTTLPRTARPSRPRSCSAEDTATTTTTRPTCITQSQ